MRYVSCLLLVIGVLFSSCKTTEEAVDTMDDIEEKAMDKKEAENEIATNRLVRHRSQLSDVYAGKKHDYPDIFEQKGGEKEEKEMDYRGFRVQLISTRDQLLADSVETKFTQWLDKNPTTYKPDSYSFFRPPNYRVHVGNFQNRERAIQYSRLLKKAFPAAWVVHDRIQPRKVPADSIKIGFATDSLAHKHDTTKAATDTLKIELDNSSKR